MGQRTTLATLGQLVFLVHCCTSGLETSISSPEREQILCILGIFFNSNLIVPTTEEKKYIALYDLIWQEKTKSSKCSKNQHKTDKHQQSEIKDFYLVIVYFDF